MLSVPDIVRLSELETTFCENPSYTQHIHIKSSRGRRALRQEERWQRRKELGSGAYSAVHLEECIFGDKKRELRAVKEIKKCSNISIDRELEAIALFSHARYQHCFVTSFGWYINGGSICIAMEYLRNGDLHGYLTRPLPEVEGKLIIRQVLEGLNYMHAFGFAHRDLKPANVLVVERGPGWWVKIADFGISKRATEGLTALRTTTGTPAFIAPEVLGFYMADEELSESYTNAVDIWSVGIMAFKILTAETPFTERLHLARFVRGRAAFPAELLRAQSIDSSGLAFIEKLLAPSPQDRPTAETSLTDQWLPKSADAPISTAYQQRPITTDKPMDLSSSRAEKTPTAWRTRRSTLDAHDRQFKEPEPSAAWTTHVLTDCGETPRMKQAFFGQDRTGDPIPYSSLVRRHPFSQLAAKAVDVVAQAVRRPSINGHTRNTSPANGRGRRKSEQRREPYAPREQAGNRRGDIEHDFGDANFPRVASRDLSPISEVHSVVQLTQGWTLVTTFKSIAGLVITISPDGKYLLVLSHLCKLTIWSIVRNEEAWSCRDKGYLVTAVMSSDGNTIVAMSSIDNTMHLWETATGTKRAVIGVGVDVLTVRVDETCAVILCRTRSGKLLLWKRIRAWEYRPVKIPAFRREPRHRVLSFALSQNGRHVLMGLPDGLVSMVDLEVWGATSDHVAHANDVHAVAMTGDGSLAASASASPDDVVKLWHVWHGYWEPGRKLVPFMHITALAFSPDGRFLVMDRHPDYASPTKAVHEVSVLDLSDEVEVQQIHRTRDRVQTAVLSSNGRFLVAGMLSGSVQLWETPASRSSGGCEDALEQEDHRPTRAL